MDTLTIDAELAAREAPLIRSELLRLRAENRELLREKQGYHELLCSIKDRIGQLYESPAKQAAIEVPIALLDWIHKRIDRTGKV